MRRHINNPGFGFYWIVIGAALIFFFSPLIPPVLASFSGRADQEGIFGNYVAMFRHPVLTEAVWNSFAIALIVAVIAPLVALLAAQAVRSWRAPRLIIGLVLLPLFIPGISMGVATALFFRQIGIEPSLMTMTVVQVLWALPFAFLIILTAMANFDSVFLEAAHMSGAGPLRAFLEIELPQIRQGLLGAALFSLILSLNETIRTSLVQGGHNTLPTYLWSQYQQVGLDPNLYALMSVLILSTLLLIIVLAVVEARQQPDGNPEEGA